MILSSKSVSLIVTLFILLFPFFLWEIDKYFYNKPKELKFEPSDNEINQKYCGTNECKFLFAYNVVEQESQSNQHFISFIQIAQQLGRIMVLTNVGESSISSLKNFPFDFYYNIDELRRKFPEVKFISQQQFQKWTKERYFKPDIIHVLLEDSKFDPNYTIQYDISYIDKLVKEYRIDQFDFNLNNSVIFKQVGVGITAGPRKSENNELREFLSAELKSNAEVMLITHETIRHAIFEKLTPMPYASHITKAALNITKKLKPYIAIHWRMEKGQINLMPKCSKSLVTYLRKLKKRTGIKNIYLATDYPFFRQNKTQSRTFTRIYEEHHTAMKILNISFNLNTWVSTHGLDYLQSYPIKNEQLQEELEGSGIQGVFDKLILTQADYFVSGPEECCRFNSTYTRQVIRARKEMLKNNIKFKNLISRWKLKPK
ncbi:12226_t:CDS:1 [Gigaspora margarita]|uniref:GDP-fucose protein O-fucosyltransferase 2 n=1 Tax=Gigaspora margarita TaxID=4874 RepID=A0ABN7VWC6_GIGMA|nr:12226_t:CDS:1 [Gigaspora margarita]